MKKIFQIEEEKNIPPGSYLLIRAGKNHFGWAIAGPVHHSLSQLSYFGESALNNESLKQIFSSNAVLEGNYSKIIIGYDFDRSLLVPSGFYKPDSSFQMIDLLYGKNGRSENFKDSIPVWQLYNLYEVPTEIHSFLTQKFESALFLHQHSVEILNYTAASGARLTIDILTGEFSVLAMKNGSLLLAQSYQYQEPDDMLYYLLKICEQSGLSPKDVEIRVSGLIEENSALYEELCQYFMNVGFRSSNWSSGNEYPTHFFTCFRDLLQCI